MNFVGVTIFAVTYVLISARRISQLGLDRPAAALLGAVACVALGVLSPATAIAAVDINTLLLLFGVMGMGAFLLLDGFFDVVQVKLANVAKSPAKLLAATVWGSGVLAAFITNDAVCLLGAPLLLRVVEEHDLPPLPFLLALATAANTGSVATLVGNPQNMLCGVLGELSYPRYAIVMVPLAVVSLAINHGVLWVSFRKQLIAHPAVSPEPAPAPRLSKANLVTLGVISLTAVIYTLGAPLAWTAAAGFVALQLLHRRDSREVWRNIDWSLLLFFAGLFVVVEGLNSSGVTEWFFANWPLATANSGPAGSLTLAAVFLLGSNVVSNVPFILVVREQMATLNDPTLGWTLLAMASTFAGNLTLLGSAANVIVAEAGRDAGSFGFWEHLRVGLPIALLTTLVGTCWLMLVL